MEMFFTLLLVKEKGFIVLTSNLRQALISMIYEITVMAQYTTQQKLNVEI